MTSPYPSLEGFSVNWLEPDRLAVEVYKGQSVSALFSQLSEQGMNVLSVRTKENRLERLFMNLIRLDAEESLEK